MKRDHCLYRVSTKGQVDVIKDDIPMQKIACREFAERNGWVIHKEYCEKGISGSKVHAEKRDAIQSLKQDAINGDFDVLLVYMFDRIGRIDDETPFVLGNERSAKEKQVQQQTKKKHRDAAGLE